MNLNNLVNPSKSINFKKDFNGDFYCYGYPTWEPEKNKNLSLFLSKLTLTTEKKIENLLKTHTPFHVTCLSKKIENQFSILKLDKEILKLFSYECPINNFKHCAIALTDYFCKDDTLKEKFFNYQPEKRKEPLLPLYSYNMISDKTFYNDFSGLTGIQSILVGEGYTEINYPNDGHSSIKHFLIELDNGDFINIALLVWFNK